MHSRHLRHFAAAAALTLIAGCASAPQKPADRSNAIMPCSFAPHCASSTNARDSAFYVEPLRYNGSTEQAHAALVDVLKRQTNAKIDLDTPPFVRSTFRTAIGFADDVSFAFRDDGKAIDVKSTSRLGFYDFGVNRRRVEQLRREFNDAMAAPGTK
ncbi:MAG: DUF1499 domain-containing protein [Dokdonella sp.]